MFTRSELGSRATEIKNNFEKRKKEKKRKEPRRNVSLGMHDRDFLKGRGVRDSSTCEPGFRHTGGWLALLGSSRLPARSHSNFSTGRRVTSLLCTMLHVRVHTRSCNDASSASICCIMSPRMIGACTTSRVILPRVRRSRCRRPSVSVSLIRP